MLPLGSAEIAPGGRTIAIVLASSSEVARDAAHRIAVGYDIERPRDLRIAPHAHQALATQNRKHDDPKVGDFAAASSTAPVTRRDPWCRLSSRPI